MYFTYPRVSHFRNGLCGSDPGRRGGDRADSANAANGSLTALCDTRAAAVTCPFSVCDCDDAPAPALASALALNSGLERTADEGGVAGTPPNPAPPGDGAAKGLAF